MCLNVCHSQHLAISIKLSVLLVRSAERAAKVPGPALQQSGHHCSRMVQKICNYHHLDHVQPAMAFRRAGCQTRWPRSATTWPLTAASARALCMTPPPMLLSSRVVLHKPHLILPICACTPMKQRGCSTQVCCSDCQSITNCTALLTIVACTCYGPAQLCSMMSSATDSLTGLYGAALQPGQLDARAIASVQLEPARQACNLSSTR